MKRRNVWLRAAQAVLLVVAVPGVMSAADPALTVRVLSAQDDGPVIRDQIRIEVFNPGSETWRNVNVRLATPGANSIERDLVQLGEIAAAS